MGYEEGREMELAQDRFRQWIFVLAGLIFSASLTEI